MDIKSIEISRSFLERLLHLHEDDPEGLADRVRFEVAEGALGSAAGLAPDDGGIGLMVLNGEDGSATVLTLKTDSDEV